MVDKEYNLSVLENVLTYNTHLKECTDSDGLFSFVKVEIVDAVQMDEDTEYHKVVNNKSVGANNMDSESHTVESASKLVCGKKIFSKLKNFGVSRSDRKQKSLESQTSNEKKKRIEPLGRPKPGRSFAANHRKRKTMISQSDALASSDCGCDSVADPNKKTKHEIVDRRPDRTVVPTQVYKDHAMDFPISMDISAAVKREWTYQSNDDSPDVENFDESFVPSSQIVATCSELQKKLNRRREATTIEQAAACTTDEDLENCSVKNEEEEEMEDAEEDEEDNQKFSLSPVMKSVASEKKKESSLSPAWQRKKKAVCRVSPLKGSIRDNENSIDKNTADASSQRLRLRKNSVASPLRGLIKDLDNCIRDDGSVEMCDSETETMSFTFETIELLNDYDDSNHRANNKILDTIFSSPAVKLEKDSTEVQPVEDPLRIDDAATNENSPALTSKRKKRSLSKSTASKKNSIKRKTVSSDVDDRIVKIKSDADPDFVSSACKRKKIGSKASNKRNDKSTESIASNKRERRSSCRLRNKVDASTIDWDIDDDKLSAKAARLAKKVIAARKDAVLPEKILKKLQNLNVRLRSPVLPQHEIENCAGSSVLSYMQQKQFLKFAPLNKGTYVPAEDEIIKKNWNIFCEDHDWDPNCYKPFLRLKHDEGLIMKNLEERRKFVQLLADGLPNRPLCSVYSRFRLLYNEYEATGQRYTKKEDEKIIAYMKCCTIEPLEHKCSELARVMKRSRISIWKRYTRLVEKNVQSENKNNVLTKVDWDLPLVEKLIKTLLDVTLSDELIDLKDAFVPRVIWRKIEKQMKIHYSVIQRFWERQLHLQLFVPMPISINETKIRLIECIHMKQIKNSKEIKWDIIAKYFDGFTIAFLRLVFNHLKKMAAAALQTQEFSEILDWLHTKKIDTLRFTTKDRFLPRISYVDKKAEILAEDISRVSKMDVD